MAVAARSLAAVPQDTESKPPLQEHPWSRHLIVLIPILTVYFCLAFYRLDHQSLWVDEVLSIIRADPAGDFLARERWFAGHGPLYFLLLHLWVQLGTSEVALRSLSTIFGAITVCLTYMIGTRFCDRRVVWIGATLMATSPFLIWYSQEVRYVMLMIAAGLFAMYSFHRALDSKGHGWWLLYTGSVILATATFVVNVFLPMAQGLYLVCSPSHRPMLRRWVAYQAVVFALFIWWANQGHLTQLGGYWQSLFVHVTTSDEQKAGMHRSDRLATGSPREFTVLALPYTFFTFSTGFSLGPSVQELHVSRSLRALWPHAVIISVCGLLFGSLFVLGLGALRGQPDTARFLVAWLAVPIIGAVGISALIPEMAYNVRYVAMSLPAYIFILARGFAGLRRPMLQILVLASVLLVNGLSLANYYHNPRYSRADARSAARFLEVAADSKDGIVIVGSVRPLQHYYKGSVPLVRWGKKVVDNGLALTDHVLELPTKHDRIWLVEIRPWGADPKGIVKAMLDNKYNRLAHTEFPGVNIYLYRL